MTKIIIRLLATLLLIGAATGVTRAQAPAQMSPMPSAAPSALGQSSLAPSASSFGAERSLSPGGSVEPGDAAAAAQAASDYRLGAGDRLRIIVFGEESLSGEFFIAGNGNVSLPLIGDVRAAGGSIREFQERVQTALREGYLKDPRVSAEVLTFRPYYVLGEVSRPGIYAYIDGITVLNAIATAGGFTYRADKHYVFVKEVNQTKERKVRLTDVVRLSPGDTIRIGERLF